MICNQIFIGDHAYTFKLIFDRLGYALLKYYSLVQKQDQKRIQEEKNVQELESHFGVSASYGDEDEEDEEKKDACGNDPADILQAVRYANLPETLH